MISVSIYEDNQRLSDLLMLLLENTEGFRVVGIHTDCTKVVEDMAKESPDVIVMDIDMPNSNGIEGVLSVKKVSQQTKVLMHTVFDDERLFECLRHGADGYMLKKDSSVMLVSAIRELMNGGAPMSPEIASMVLKAFRQPLTNEYHLTEREKEILESLTNGNSYKMIAAECFISTDTVRRHLQNIYLKLQVQSAPEAVAKALRERLVK
ncbi:MAG: response regulator transcription factor [Bacteroidota bacterium]|jgi:DNA-binding NarL/FixJ family response regulator